MQAYRIIVTLAVMILLPLMVFYGANLIAPVPSDLSRSASVNYDQKLNDAKTPAEKQKVELERAQHESAEKVLERRHERALFSIAYPVGLLAFLAGGLLRLRANNIGLLCGGLITITLGCCSYWENMDRYGRFFALFGALVIVLIYGYYRFQPDTQRETRV